MELLKVNDIFNYVNKLQKEGMNYKDIMALPIYIGNDEELNGIHNSWFCNIVDDENKEDKYYIEMINEDYANVKLKGKAILIS